MDGINACAAYCGRCDACQVALGLGSPGNASLSSAHARVSDPKIDELSPIFLFR